MRCGREKTKEEEERLDTERERRETGRDYYHYGCAAPSGSVYLSKPRLRTPGVPVRQAVYWGR